MEIAWFTDTWLPTRDGVVNSLLSFKEVIESKGNKVYIFAPGNKNELQDNIIYYKAKPYSKYPNYRITAISSLFSKRTLKIIKSIKPDIIHSHSPGIIGTNAVISSHFAKIPLVFTYHTFLQDSVYFFSEGMQKFSKKLLEIWLKWYFRRCNVIIAPSKYVANQLEKYNKKIEIIPTGIDIKKFEKGNGKRIKSKFEGKKLILHVGRIVKEKNIDLLIKAAPHIIDKIDAIFLIIGEGPAKIELEKMVKKMGLEKEFLFTGFIPDEELADYYRAADVFIFPSTYETQGIVVLEAMASGLPVVAARARAIPEFVFDGENGFLFSPGDEKELAEKILIGMDAKDVVKKARKFVEKYSIEKMGEKLIEFYENESRI